MPTSMLPEDMMPSTGRGKLFTVLLALTASRSVLGNC